MPITPPPESERLARLRMYRILDTAAERSFDNLTALAGVICGTPIALISLVDERRQWFKARVGLEARETPRSIAFCAHAIQKADELFVVEDASADGRFASNPLVVGDPRIRFYAGAPLVVAGGAALGTLCVIDHRPRSLTADQRRALEILRDSVVEMMELRRLRHEVEGLSGLLPVCAWCLSVRDGQGEWQSPSQYLAMATRPTHSICPSCRRQTGVDREPAPPKA